MSDGTGVLTIGTMPIYMAPETSRVSDDVQRITPVPTPLSNDNPSLPIDVTHYNEQTENIRDLDFDPGRTRRGFIAWFLNPFQWSLGFDTFIAGKVATGKQSATAMAGGMAPNTPQRANIPTMQVSSYGDLLTASTDGAGIDPYVGW